MLSNATFLEVRKHPQSQRISEKTVPMTPLITRNCNCCQVGTFNGKYKRFVKFKLNRV